MTSAYKIASNRGNGARGRGPTTAAGKQRVRLNAIKHGLTAETAVLPGEDPEAFERHRDGILGTLKPGDDVWLALARACVLATWKTLRCERAETGLTTHRMHHAALEAAKEEQHRVIDLGRRLFTDQRGDMRDYPHDALEIHYDKRTSAPGAPEDPFDPEHILIELESTIAGCDWLLARWAELKANLAPGLSWHSPDKFRCVRLLGRQPLDAPDFPEVCLVYLASHVADPRFSNPFYELAQEFEPDTRDYKHFKERLKERPWKELRPRNEAEARRKLAELIDKCTARIEKIKSAHEKRAEQYASKGAGQFLFDPSDESERLRRHQRACTRDTFRAISQFNLHRECESLLAQPELASLPVFEEPLATSDEEILQNEPNADCNGETASAGQAGESAEPALKDPAGFEATACPWPAGEPPPPCDQTMSPQPSESSDNSALSRPPFALPLPRTDGTWLTLLSASRMARAAAALSKRREGDRLRRKAARQDNRRWRAERLERRRQREQAKLAADGACTESSPTLRGGVRSTKRRAPIVARRSAAGVRSTKKAVRQVRPAARQRAESPARARRRFFDNSSHR
jgi:hypothetical protein